MNPKELLVVSLSGLLASVAGAQPLEPTVFVPHNYSLGSSIGVMNLDDGGGLSFVELESFGVWCNAAAISPNGRLLAAVNPAGNSDGFPNADYVYFFRVNRDSTLTALTSHLIPTSPLDLEWVGNETIAILETDISNSSLSTYHYNEKLGQFTQVDNETPGGFISAIVGDLADSKLYTNNSNNGLILRWSVDASGALELDGAIPTGIYNLDFSLAHSGLFLLGAGGISNGGDKVGCYATVGEVLPVLSQVAGSPFVSPGSSPARVAFSEDDSIVAVAHGSDAEVHTFLFDSESGQMTPTGFFFDVGTQGTAGDVEFLNGYLLVADDSTVFDGVQGLYVFDVGADGSLTQIGDINDTGNTRAEGHIAVWPGICPGDRTTTGASPGDTYFGIPDGSVDLSDLLFIVNHFDADLGPTPGSLADTTTTGTMPGDPGYGLPDGEVDLADLLFYVNDWTVGLGACQ